MPKKLGDKRSLSPAAAHDLRGPLTAILLFAELFEEDSAALSVDQRELIRSIHTASESALRLLDGMDASPNEPISEVGSSR